MNPTSSQSCDDLVNDPVDRPTAHTARIRISLVPKPLGRDELRLQNDVVLRHVVDSAAHPLKGQFRLTTQFPSQNSRIPSVKTGSPITARLGGHLGAWCWALLRDAAAVTNTIGISKVAKSQRRLWAMACFSG